MREGLTNSFCPRRICIERESARLLDAYLLDLTILEIQDAKDRAMIKGISSTTKPTSYGKGRFPTL
jgi:hypothetical protein